MNILKRKKDLRDGLFFAVMMAIPTVQFIIFYVIKNFSAVLMAFQVFDPKTGGVTYTFENFTNFFYEWKTTDSFQTMTLNSLTFSVFSVVVAPIICIMFSLYVYRKELWSGAFKVLLFIPSIVSSIVIVRVHTAVFDGMIPEIWKIITGDSIKGLLANLETRKGTIIFSCLWGGFGPSMLIYVGAMSAIDESISEAAKLDGAGFLRESLHITLPLVYPTIVVQFIAGLAGIFVNQMNLYSFYGDTAHRSISTVGYWLYNMVQRAKGNYYEYPYISAVGMLCTLIIVPITLGMRYVLNKVGPKTE